MNIITLATSLPGKENELYVSIAATAIIALIMFLAVFLSGRNKKSTPLDSAATIILVNNGVGVPERSNNSGITFKMILNHFDDISIDFNIKEGKFNDD